MSNNRTILILVEFFLEVQYQEEEFRTENTEIIGKIFFFVNSVASVVKIDHIGLCAIRWLIVIVRALLPKRQECRFKTSCPCTLFHG